MLNNHSSYNESIEIEYIYKFLGSWETLVETTLFII